MTNELFILYLQDIQNLVKTTRNSLEHASVKQVKRKQQSHLVQPNEIEVALGKLSQPLALSYAQARADLEGDRITWVSIAHEIREVLRQMLDILAPDTKVMQQNGYKQEPNTKGPTQKQRAVYILRQRGAGSSEEDMIKKIDLVEELISGLVRDTYTRASVAAHGQKDRKEAQRLLKYFDAFAHDLLNL